ncbi:MAG TPA: hypothetical protein VMV28_06865 [Thermoplasmata archaeon]|nr:hypothetical protein [Thermoplasmata archaeon]
MGGICVERAVHKKTVVAVALGSKDRRIQQAKFGPTDSEMVSYLAGLGVVASMFVSRA